MTRTLDVLDWAEGNGWALANADCVDFARQLPDNSIDMGVESPPFSKLYCYSSSERDMGNSADDGEFFAHYEFLLREQFRILRPGRIWAVHCKNLVDYQGSEALGRSGLRDFRGDIIRAYERAGFKLASEVTIWKSAPEERNKTNAHGLLYRTLVGQRLPDGSRDGEGDSSFARMGLPDYLCIFRKWPTTPAESERIVPVRHSEAEMPLELWRQVASPVWVTYSGVGADGPEFAIPAEDIRITDTLNVKAARDSKDEAHLCLAEGSLVLTREHGYHPIELVEPGDHVLTHAGRWRPVLARRCNGVADTVKVCAQGVANLVATPDHKLYARKASGKHAKEIAMKSDAAWINASETLGSYVNISLPPVEDNELTADEWWIVGRWLGDGHRGIRRTSGARGAGFGDFLISCSHKEAPGLLRRLGDNARKTHEGTATQFTLRKLRHVVRETLSRCGVGAANKRVPGEAVTLCQEKAEALLSGYLSADGHYVRRYDRHVASSVSRALLLGMSLVAMRARGVVASVYAGRPEREGIICGRKVHMCQDWVMSFRGSDGYKKSGWIDDLGSWRKVRKIEDAGERRVWDLQVEEDESFAAEGCIVHNCPLQLPVIRRAVHLYSNPNDVVMSSFAGIGSEGDGAMTTRDGTGAVRPRRFIGCELKPSYFTTAVRNLKAVEPHGKGQTLSLFGDAAPQLGLAI